LIVERIKPFLHPKFQIHREFTKVV